MHSVVQGKELHKDALIIILYVIPRRGKMPFTFVFLQVIKRSWCTMKQRFSILLYSGVHIRLPAHQTSALTKTVLMASR